MSWARARDGGGGGGGGEKEPWFDNPKKENSLAHTHTHTRVDVKIVLKLILENLFIADLTRLSETRDQMVEDAAVHICLNLVKIYLK
jgi:hypothetical protein